MARRKHKPEEIVAKLRPVRRCDVARSIGRGSGSNDRRDGGYLLSVAPGVRRAEDAIRRSG